MEPTFNSQGLIPVIVQEQGTKDVLMLAYMNKAAYEKTLETKDLYFYSRSRKSLWKKGQTSGNTQALMSLSYDCDQDSLLALVDQKGPACHTGNKSCFYRDMLGEKSSNDLVLETLYQTIIDKKNKPDQGYTTYLFEKGLDKILKKVAEETGEVIIASKNNNDETIYEIADLFYHVLVLMVNQGIGLDDIYEELRKRRK